MKTKTVASSIVAAIVSCACLFMFVPTATAAEGVTVTSTKSFPSYTQVRKDLTTEATATSVEDNADWGGIENLDVPQTESQAEKDAAAAKKAAEEEAEKQAEVEAQATQEQANAASRNESRSSVTYSDASGSVSAGARCLYRPCVFFDRTEYGLHRIGQSSVGGRGINFHGWPEEYVNVPGGHVVTDGSLQPGDILIYANTRWMERWCTLRSCGVVCRQRSGGPWWMEWL